MFQNILNVLIIVLLMIVLRNEGEHSRQINSIFYIIDTLQDIMIEKFKEKSNEEKTEL